MRFLFAAALVIIGLACSPPGFAQTTYGVDDPMPYTVRITFIGDFEGWPPMELDGFPVYTETYDLQLKANGLTAFVEYEPVKRAVFDNSMVIGRDLEIRIIDNLASSPETTPDLPRGIEMMPGLQIANARNSRSDLASPEECLEVCRDDPGCIAFAFVVDDQVPYCSLFWKGMKLRLLPMSRYHSESWAGLVREGGYPIVCSAPPDACPGQRHQFLYREMQ